MRMHLPTEVIDHERQADGLLGALRYKWCVTHGFGAAAYASQCTEAGVPLSRQAVQESVDRHCARNGLARPLAKRRSPRGPSEPDQPKQSPPTIEEHSSVPQRPTLAVVPVSTAQADAVLDTAVIRDTEPRCSITTLPVDVATWGLAKRLNLIKHELRTLRDELRAGRYIETPEDASTALTLAQPLTQELELINHYLTAWAPVSQTEAGK